jgi:hypothetical protein
LDFLMAQPGREAVRSSDAGADVQMIACLLGRLGEMPSSYFTHAQQQQIQDSLTQLERARTPDGGWKCQAHSDDDAETTAWAIIALRLQGRSVPEPALRMLLRCRRPDGGFAAHPGEVFRQSAPATTALAIRALRKMDSAAEDFFALHLEATNAGSRDATPRFTALAEILDWEPGMASPYLLDKVRKLTPDFGGDSVMNQALLLRCLLRLRNRWAWPLAASLRAGQKEDGSWVELETTQTADVAQAGADNKIVPTVTAVSALVLDELQPGLYFGSDSPLPPRKLRDC